MKLQIAYACLAVCFAQVHARSCLLQGENAAAFYFAAVKYFHRYTKAISTNTRRKVRRI